MNRAVLNLRPLLLLVAVLLAPFLRAESERVLPAQFLPQLAAQLAAHFGVSGDLQLDLLRSWQPPAAPAGEWTMTVVAPPQVLVPQMVVRVRLAVGQRNLGEWNLPLRAQLWGDAFAVRQPLARGDAIDPALLDLRRVDLLREKDAILAGTDMGGMSVARGVGVGTMLTWRDVARRTLVQRGNHIEVVATDGALTITMKALAMQNGALGETIVVRNPESRRDFSAVVTAENRARVTF
jgi:flagella basal body P-ring formation protein FlgA